MYYLKVNQQRDGGKPGVGGMLPFWWPIYRTLGVLGLTRWQGRLMTDWIPRYEERRFTEQKCLAAVKAAKDSGMEIAVPDIENKTAFSGILDPEGWQRKAWAEAFADSHAWVPVMVYGTEKRVRVRKGDNNWTELYQHNWEATTAYLDEVKPEIPYGTHFSKQILLRDALSAPADEIIPQRMRPKAFEQALELHRLRNKPFPGKQKRFAKLLRFAGVLALLMALNFKIISPATPFHIQPLPHPLPHHLTWSDSALPSSVNPNNGSWEEAGYSAAYLQQIFDWTKNDNFDESRSDTLAALAHAAAKLKDTVASQVLLEQTLTEGEKIHDEAWRSVVLASVAREGGTLKDTVVGRALIRQVKMATVQISGAQPRAAALSGIAEGYAALGAQSQSVPLLEETLADAQRITEQGWRTKALASIARAAGTLRNTPQATALLEQTLMAVRTLGDGNAQAEALSGVAQGYAALGAQTQSAPLLGQALALSKTISGESWRSPAIAAIAQAAGTFKNSTQAGALVEQTLAAAKEIHDDNGRAVALYRVAMAAGTLKDTEHAFALLKQTATAAGEIIDESWRAQALTGVAQGYATMGSHAQSAGALEKILAAAQNLPEQDRAGALAGVAQGAGALQDTTTGKMILEKVLTADLNISNESNRGLTLAGVARGAWALRDRTQGLPLLEQTLTVAENSKNNSLLTQVVQSTPKSFWLRQMEENRDPQIRIRITNDLHRALNGGPDAWSANDVPTQSSMATNPLFRESEGAGHRWEEFNRQIAPSVQREAFDENAEVRAAAESLAETAGAVLPNDVERFAEREIAFTGIRPSTLDWLLLLLPEWAALFGLNAAGGAFVRKDGKRSRTAQSLKVADAKVLLRAAGYSDPAVRELLQPMSLTPEDLQRVMPERLATDLDIVLQGLLVSACASPEEAIPILSALESRSEALRSEWREGDIRHQAQEVRDMLQAICHGQDTALIADALRCLTRLNRFLDAPMTEPGQTHNVQRAEETSIVPAGATPPDASIESEAPDKKDADYQQRIQEQYGSQKRDDALTQRL